MRRASLLLVGLVAAAPACRDAAPPAADAAPVPWFADEAAARGLTARHRSGHTAGTYRLPEIVGGGAALFDMDGDGDLDVLLVQSGTLGGEDPEPRHRLYRNDGAGHFEDVTAGSGVEVPGYGIGVATGDYDGDGDLDVYLTNLGANVLLRNDGRGRFTDVTAEAGVAGAGWSTGAAFLDADGDGRLDLFVARYVDWTPARERRCFGVAGLADYCRPTAYDAPASPMLFRNTGDGRFTDASAASGLTAAVGHGLGVVVDDVDGDGRLDVFVANDRMPNHLWMNRGGGRFVESALLGGVAADQDGALKGGTGVHAADVDGDGDNDIVVMHLDTEADSYYRNDGRFFVEATGPAGLRVASRRFSRFGAALVDFDNDGRLDLFEATGRVGRQDVRSAADPYAEPNLLLRGLDRPGFEEVRPRGGTTAPLVRTSRAAVFGDIDDDGGMDVLVVNRDEAPTLLRNIVTDRGHWLLVAVRDARGSDALGARLTLRAGGRLFRRDVRTAYGYLAANDPRVHVGLGAVTTVEAVDVRWPDGAAERFGPFPADGVVTVRRGEGTPVPASATTPR